MNIYFFKRGRLNFIILLFTTLFLTACATGQSYQDHSAQLSTLAVNEARVYIYRPSSSSSSITPKIYIGGKNVGRSVTNGFLVADVKAGVNTIKTSEHSKKTITFLLKENEDNFIRAGVKRQATRNEVTLEMMDSEVGRSEITETYFKDPKN